MLFLWIFIPRHTIVAGYYGFMSKSVCLSVGPSVACPSVRFSFPDDNLSKHQWIFTKFGVCIDIVEIWFGIANGQISSNFDSYLPKTRLYFRFRMITWININGFSPNLVCALILWRSGLGLLMGKFSQILTELSAWDTPIFSFPDDNLSTCQGILTKIGTCIDMKEISFGIANGQISSMFDRVICPRHDNGGVL